MARRKDSDDYDDEEGELSRSSDDVFKRPVFQYPALGGIIVVALAFYAESPYQWVVLFFYFLFGLPGLYLFAKHQPPGENTSGSLPIELESYQPLRTQLQRGKIANRIDRAQAEEAFDQFEEAIRVYQASKSKSPPLASRARQQSDATFKYVMENLSVISTLFRQLDAIDARNVLRKIQSFEGRSDLTERDKKELKIARAQAEEREQMLSSLIDRLQANQLVLATIETGLPPPTKR